MFLKDIDKEIPPKGYIDRNYLDYYVFRNNSILKQLFKERWVKINQLLVAGHSEGSTVAVKMASINKKITHLIYSGGNPYGRITTILEQSRFDEKDSVPQGQNVGLQHFPGKDIQRCKGLIHENDFRVHGQNLDDVDPLAHSTGQLIRIGIFKA